MRAASPHPYRRLAGRRRRVGTLWTAARHSLWLGMDHVLQVENRFYSEEYRRFYYRDIQMLLVRRTVHWIVWNVLWGVLLGAGIFLGLQAGEPIIRSLGAGLAGLAALILLVNSLYGPTCACQVHTAVQTVALPSLNRLRYVRKTLARLQPLIAQAQGELSPEMLAAGWAAAPSEHERQATAGRRAAARAARLQPFRAGRHAVLFTLLMLDGMATLLSLQHPSIVILLATWGIMLGVFIAMLLALIMQQQSDCPTGLRRLTWGVGIYMCLLYVARTIPWTIMSMQTPQLAMVRSSWDVLRLLAAHSPHENLYVHAMSLMALVCSLGLGAGGWLCLARVWRQQPTPPPFPLASPPAL